jgi:hypothetical protein
MSQCESRSKNGRAPRVVTLGSLRDPLGMSADGFHRALAAAAEVEHLDTARPIHDGVRLYRAAAALIHRDAFELVHVLDPRLAPIGAMLHRRHGVPASLTLTADVQESRRPWAALARRSLGAFAEAFVAEDDFAGVAGPGCRGVPLYTMPVAARELPLPSPRDVARVARALHTLTPRRPIVAVPWPRTGTDFRWFRDVVMPHLSAQPVCVLFGVTSRRQLRLMLQAAGSPADVRSIAGPLTASLIAAVARVADAFAAPAPSRPDEVSSGVTMALTVSGVPVVTNAMAFDCVAAHETSGLMIDKGDESGFIAALDNVLALPAVQRRFLGEDIARSTLRERPWQPVAEAYTERFSALVGRPVIPAALRAA